MLFSREASGGFTRKEILIVTIFCLAVIAIIFIILNPVNEQRAARNAERWSDISAIMAAIKIGQATGNDVVANLRNDEVYMITRGMVTAGCDDSNAYCDLPIADDTHCLDLTGLVATGQIAEVPESPRGKNKWVAPITGYILRKDANGILMVAACESEDADMIWVAR